MGLQRGLWAGLVILTAAACGSSGAEPSGACTSGLTQVDPLFVSDNAALPSFEMPLLTTIAKFFLFQNNDAATTVRLAKVTALGQGLVFSSNDVATELTMPLLTSISTISITDNPALTTLTLPLLVTITDSVTVSRIASNASLRDCLVTALATRTAHTIYHSGNTGVGSCP